MTEPAAPEDAQRAAEILARNVSAARKARGLTQQELGVRSGLLRSRINRIEKAAAPDNNSTMRILVALARGLGLHTSEVYRLLIPQGLDDADTLPPPELGEHYPIRDGTLAVELPAGRAFEAARLYAAQSGHPVLLVDPRTREVAGIAGIKARD